MKSSLKNKMTTQEHLAAIVRHIDKLLAIAEKRTPGEWEIQPHKGWHKEFNVGPATIDYDDVDHDEQDANATFISSCAGNAEAGWRATKHAAEWLGFMIETGEEFQVRGLIDTILAAWPVELLKEGEA